MITKLRDRHIRLLQDTKNASYTKHVNRASHQYDEFEWPCHDKFVPPQTCSPGTNFSINMDAWNLFFRRNMKHMFPNDIFGPPYNTVTNCQIIVGLNTWVTEQFYATVLHDYGRNRNTGNMIPFATLATLNHVYINYLWHSAFAVYFYNVFTVYFHLCSSSLQHWKHIHLHIFLGIQAGAFACFSGRRGICLDWSHSLKP